MFKPRNETEDLLLSITKNCKTLINQTHKKAEETLEFKLVKSRESFSFYPPIQIEGSWMIGLINLGVYNSIFNITNKNNKFELYSENIQDVEEITFENSKDLIAKNLDVSNIEDNDLLDDMIGDIIVEEYRKIYLEKSREDGYTILLNGYIQSVFQHFESYLRTERVSEDDIELVLKEFNSKFKTYELTPGIYSFKDISDALKHFGCHVEYDDISMRTDLLTNKILRFDKNSFFKSLLGFSSGWDYKNNNDYVSDEITDLSTIDKIHLKCDCIHGSIQDGERQPILFSFILDKPSGYKIFCSPETIHYKKVNKTVLDNITFYLENDNNEEVNFNGESITFTLRLVKI